MRDGFVRVAAVTPAIRVADPAYNVEKVIEGGNHAFVGSYGRQEGDGEAGITAQEQQEMIVRLVMEAIRSH